MKKIIIFGAGDAGRQALACVGKDYVDCFVDNHKQGMIDGVPIRDFKYLIENAENYAIIIGTFDFIYEMRGQLEAHGIHEYLLWQRPYYVATTNFRFANQIRPFSMMYILEQANIDKNKKITVYSDEDIIELVLFLLSCLGIQGEIKHFVEYYHSRAFNAPESMKHLVYHHNNVNSVSQEEFDAIIDDTDLLVLAVMRQRITLIDVDEINDWAEYEKCQVVDLYGREVFAAEIPEVKKFKNIHRGKRCFIIGNGPSLRPEDLDVLYKHGEICFGVNQIYKIFDKTPWRPAYFCVADTYTFKNNTDDLRKFKPQNTFVSAIENYPDDFDAIKINIIYDYYLPHLARFSADLEKYVYCGWSVTYSPCIQLAAYMGFEEIYLLGVDNTNYVPLDQLEHFCDDYCSQEEMLEIKQRKVDTPRHFNPKAPVLAFRAAEKYSQKHGFRIFNATRGGILEEFERVDFDNLFHLK